MNVIGLLLSASVAGALVSFPGGPPASMVQESPGDGSPEELIRILAEASPGYAREIDALAVRLASRGSSSLGQLFRLLDQERVPAEWNVSASGGRRRSPRLDAGRLAAIEGALVRMPLSDLREHLRSVARTVPSASARAAGLRILSAVGTERELGLALSLAGAATTAETVPRELRVACERVLVEIMERTGRGQRELQEAFGAVHSNLQATIVFALEGRGGSVALDALSTILPRAPREMKALVLTSIGRVGGSVTHPIEEDTRAALRPYLEDVSVANALAAVYALGELEDYESAPALIAFLDGNEENLAGAAHRALSTMTGLQLKNDAVLWKRWYREDKHFWETERTIAIDSVARRSRIEAARALQRLAACRLNRHRLASELKVGLAHREPEIRRLTCEALRLIDSPVVALDLAECLGSRDGAVSKAAWEALRSITGLDLPLDLEAWRAALGMEGVSALPGTHSSAVLLG